MWSCIDLCTALLGSWRILGCLVWPPELGRGRSEAPAVARGSGDGISQADCCGSLGVPEPVLGLRKVPARDDRQRSRAGS